MKTVLFQGTFEIINAGHILAFELAKKYGDKLIVALNTNELVRSYKKREPVLPWGQKKIILEAIRYIDEVIPATEFSPMGLLQEIKPNVFVVGSEFEKTHKKALDFVRSYGGEVVVSPRFPDIVSTSSIKAALLAEAQAR